MKKVFVLLAMCVTLPLSVFALSTDIVVIKNGTDSIVVQPKCGEPD